MEMGFSMFQSLVLIVTACSAVCRGRQIDSSRPALAFTAEMNQQFVPEAIPRALTTMQNIIIIGAGPSGIAAATRLIEKGMNPAQITILEAENRIGGRVNTVHYGPSVIEMGAQWVHGEKGNVVYQLAAAAGEIRTDLHTQESTGYADNVKTVYKDGRKIRSADWDKFQRVIDSITADAEIELVQWKGSLGKYITQKFGVYLDKGSLPTIDRATALDFLDWAHRAENIEDASDSWFESSGVGFLEYEECAGDEDIVWKRGYSALFEILMRNLPKKQNGSLPLSDRIQLNSPVNLIRWNPVSGSSKVQVISSGKTYEADMVLVTCSLGVLKDKANSLFIPNLPVTKKKAIEGLGFGTVNKIFLEFRKPWWNGNWGGVNLLNNHSNLTSDWENIILGFYTVREQPNLLISWISGAAARKFETLSDTDALQKLSALLRKAVGKENFTYEEPTKLIRSSWNSNPNFRGSYSFRSTKSEDLDVWASDLAKPVVDSNGKIRLLFAGEATHNRYYSTVHGAVETGWREADRILKLMNNG